MSSPHCPMPATRPSRMTAFAKYYQAMCDANACMTCLPTGTTARRTLTTRGGIATAQQASFCLHQAIRATESRKFVNASLLWPRLLLKLQARKVAFGQFYGHSTAGLRLSFVFSSAHALKFDAFESACRLTREMKLLQKSKVTCCRRGHH